MAGKSYASRNRMLRKLGYSDYLAYLRSTIWREIRERALDRDFHRCLVCGGVANQVHHLHYSRMALLGKDLCALVSLCGKCHENVEFDGDVKLSVQGMRRAWRRTKKKIVHRLKPELFDSLALHHQQSDHLRSIMGR